MINLKRIYEDFEESDGFRILIDRLWPRGLSKENAKIDLWLKEIAPSESLRKWFGHDPVKWEEFKEKYIAELKSRQEQIEEVKALAKTHKVITLLYAAKDENHNNAVVLKEVLS